MLIEDIHERRFNEIIMYTELLEENKTIEEIDDIIFDSVDGIELELYGVHDLEIIFQCEHQKALRIMKLLFSLKYAVKIGKTYYVKHADFERFFDDFKGKDIAI